MCLKLLFEGKRAGNLAVYSGARCHREVCTEQGLALSLAALAPRTGCPSLAWGSLAPRDCQRGCLAWPGPPWAPQG